MRGAKERFVHKCVSGLFQFQQCVRRANGKRKLENAENRNWLSITRKLKMTDVKGKVFLTNKIAKVHIDIISMP